MARSCAVCANPERRAIDAALVAGEAPIAVSAKYRVSADSVLRHRANHLPHLLVMATQAVDAPPLAPSLLAQVRAIQERTLVILASAEEGGSLRFALQAIREARLNLELLARMTGELDDRPQIDIMVNPQWLDLRAVLLRTLAPHPAALEAVADAFAALEAAG